MRTPLTVTLDGPAGFRAITKRVGDTSFSSDSPGGFASITTSFAEPITNDFLDGYETLTVYDGQTGEVACQGRLTDPGKSTGSGGEVWQITAIGEGPAHMADNTVPLVYIETSMDGFYPLNRFSASATVEVGATPDATSDAAVVIAVPGGTTVGNGFIGGAYYDRIGRCGQQLGGFAFTRKGGILDGNWNVLCDVYALDGTPALQNIFDTNLTVGPAISTARVITTDFTAGQDVLRLGMSRDGGAVTVANDTTWIGYYDLFVAARRLNSDGSSITPADHGNPYVLASEVVADLLGRGLLPRFDGDAAVINTSSHQFDQLAWYDGITPGGIVNDLIAVEPFTWHAWEKQSNDLYRFEFVEWPTTVRYDASVVDGFDSPSPTSDVYTEVNVRYRNKRGRIDWATRTQTVSGAIERSTMIDISDEKGSLVNANGEGDRFLADHASPPNTGTLRIARPVMDSVTGRMTKPWMIRPGNLIRVRGVRPNIDSLNADDRDGVTVFRIVSTSFSDSDGAATLELDTYSPTEARQIERLTNARRRKN